MLTQKETPDNWIVIRFFDMSTLDAIHMALCWYVITTASVPFLYSYLLQCEDKILICVHFLCKPAVPDPYGAKLGICTRKFPNMFHLSML